MAQSPEINNSGITDSSSRQPASWNESVMQYASKGVATTLQTTLELDELLTLFITEVESAVPCDAIEYHKPESGFQLHEDELGRHCCSYRIKLGQHHLGDITFIRYYKFLNIELARLENLVSALVYPLRNTLQYQAAIHSARTDPLTGLRNRNHFNDTLEMEVERAHRYNESFSLLVIDIDYFKRINDQYGHLAGDGVLVELASRLQNKARGCDQIFRYGGEEFVVLMPNTTIIEADIVAKRIRHAAQDDVYVYGDIDFCLTLSIGVSALRNGDSALELLSRADKAMYQAKSLGRDRIELADSLPIQ